MIDAASIVLRALGFIALFQAAGLAIFLALFRQQLHGEFERSLRRTAGAFATAGLLLLGVQFAVEPARLGGALAAILDPTLRDLAWRSPAGSALAWRLIGLTVLLVGLSSDSLTGRATALAGAALALIAFAQVGHTTTFTPRPLLVALLLLHLGIMAFWFGALLPLRRLALHPGGRAASIVEAFSRLALWLVPVLFAAGVALSALLLRSWQALLSPYGRMLVLKVALFAALMLLAALNRWRYGPGLARSHSTVIAFRRTVLAEFVLIAAALGITAALTSLYSPDS